MRREGLLDLNEAVQNPGKRLEFDVVSELQHEEDLDLIEPVSGRIRAVGTGNLLLLEGEFRTTCVLECARCGEPLHVEVRYEMSDQFDVEGVPSSFGSGCYAEVVEDEPSPLFQKNALVTERWIRQGLIVNLPTQVLCSYGWDGPCPNAAKLPHTSEGPHGHPAMERLRLLKSPSEPDE